MTQELADPNFEWVAFADAAEMLRALAPLPLLVTETPCPRFIFRGQGDASMPLIPSALRRPDGNNVRTEAQALLDFKLDGAADHQVWAEIHILKMFIESCDRAGIALPGDGFEFRKTWMDDQKNPLQSAYQNPSEWPFPAHLPI